MHGRVAAACLLVMGLGGWTRVSATDHPVTGMKLLLKQARNGTQTLLFVSKDPGFPFPAIGSADDPATGAPGGAAIELFSVPFPGGATLTATGGVGWSSRDATVDSFKFTNRAAPGGGSPVKAIALRQAKSARIVARSTPAGRVAARARAATSAARSRAPPPGPAPPVRRRAPTAPTPRYAAAARVTRRPRAAPRRSPFPHTPRLV